MLRCCHVKRWGVERNMCKRLCGAQCRDIAPEGATLAESNAMLEKVVELAEHLQAETGKKVLWGTAQLFKHPRYMHGAATSEGAPSMLCFLKCTLASTPALALPTATLLVRSHTAPTQMMVARPALSTCMVQPAQGYGGVGGCCATWGVVLAMQAVQNGASCLIKPYGNTWCGPPASWPPRSLK